MATNKPEKQPVTETVAALIRPAVEALGLELWDVTFQKEGVDWCLSIYIDRLGGADLNCCEAVSRAVDPLLDAADPIDQSYYLQVFTPGLERKLTKPEHFDRYRGKKVFVRTIRPLNGVREFHGVLDGFEAGEVRLTTAADLLVFPLKSLAFVKADDFDDLPEAQESEEAGIDIFGKE